MTNEKVLDLSWDTIFKVIVSIIFFYILFQIKDILIWFIFAIIISILFSPGIDFLMKFKVPKIASVSIVYFSVFGTLALLFYFMISAFVSEIEQFSQVLPLYFTEFSPLLRDAGIYAFEDIGKFISEIRTSLGELTRAVFGAFFVFFGGVFLTFFVITLAFFISLEGRVIERAVTLIFPKKYESYALSLWEKSQKQVSGWFLTRILSCIFVGAAIYISALVIGARYPLSMGLISGAFNFIPYVGALISGIFIFTLTMMDSIDKAIFILIAFVIIQAIEGGVLTPILSKKFLGLSPVLVILALAIGETLWGFLGALLAIPLAGIIFEFGKEFLEKKKKEEATL